MGLGRRAPRGRARAASTAPYSRLLTDDMPYYSLVITSPRNPAREHPRRAPQIAPALRRRPNKLDQTNSARNDRKAALDVFRRVSERARRSRATATNVMPYPPPPSFYKLYDPAREEPPPGPPPPAVGQYTAFGATHTVRAPVFLPSAPNPFSVPSAPRSTPTRPMTFAPR